MMNKKKKKAVVRLLYGTCQKHQAADGWAQQGANEEGILKHLSAEEPHIFPLDISRGNTRTKSSEYPTNPKSLDASKNPSQC